MVEPNVASPPEEASQQQASATESSVKPPVMQTMEIQEAAVISKEPLSPAVRQGA